jgi:hypothetical protein
VGLNAAEMDVDSRFGDPSETLAGGDERGGFVAMDRADGLSRVAEEDAGDGAGMGMEGGDQRR